MATLEKSTPPRSIAARALLDGKAMLSRSFRMHRPRGAFCHDGWCQQCKVRLDDGSVVLACQQACSKETALRPRSRILRVLGWVAERQHPWFYENHFLRPAFLRQFYLKVLRRLSGSMPLPHRSPPEGGAWRRLSADLLVVGGGVAGLEAARAFCDSGRSVTVVDVGRSFVPPEHQLIVARQAAVDAGCVLMDGALCVGLYEAPRRALCVDKDGTLVVEHQELVVATGAYDRLLPFPNNDLPGIIGVRALEILLAQTAITPDTRIGIYGEPEEVERALRALGRAGIACRWIAGPHTLPPVPVEVSAHSNTEIQTAHGSERIRGVSLSDVGDLTCDLLVLGFSQPGYELQMQRQARLTLQGRPSKLSPDISGTGVMVVGSAAGRAGVDAVERTQGSAPEEEAFICPCEDVRVRDITQAIADGYNDIELIKRHTGAATGPCQGKLCHGNLMDCLSALGVEAKLPTQRPLVRPVRFAQFAGAQEE